MNRLPSGLAIAFLLFAVLNAGCAGQHSASEEKLWPCTQPVLAAPVEYKLDRWADPLIIPVVWHGKPACFVVDTGATMNFLDLNAFPNLKAIGNEEYDLTPSGSKKGRLFNPPDVTVGPFNLAVCGPVLPLDTSLLRAVSDLHIIGIIGLASMENCVLQIDFDQHRFRFLPSDVRAHPEWGTSFPIRIISARRSYVNWSVEGANCYFLLDTGDLRTMSVPAKLFDYLHSKRARPIRLDDTASAGGLQKFRQMRMPTLDLAGMAYRDMIIDEFWYIYPGLGLGFFERHLTTIDFPNRRLYLRPGKEFAHRDRSIICGLHCLRQGADWVIYEVENDGPASNTGLLKGDVIVSINGITVASKTRSGLSDLFYGDEGTEITVTVRRGSLTKTVKIKLHSAS